MSPAPSPAPVVWERRWHPLRAEWVLFTSHRGGRPWIGQTVPGAGAPPPPSYDPTCALCPGNARLGAARNPAYTGSYVFTNDLPTFSDDAPAVGGADEEPGEDADLYRRAPAFGTAEVICYHPDHAKTFADLTAAQAGEVVALWTERQRALAARPTVRHVLIFENKGAVVGTSNPHPHGQIYAGSLVYETTAREVRTAGEHFRRRGGRLLGLDVLARELAGGAPRVVYASEHFVALVPWFARYAYEVCVLPRAAAASLLDLDADRRRDLAETLRQVAVAYDNLWQLSMPYVMALHQAPTDGANYRFYPFHVEFHPPLRKPDTLKYLAGPEVGGGSMTNESDPDVKAAELRAAVGPLYRADGADGGGTLPAVPFPSPSPSLSSAATFLPPSP